MKYALIALVLAAAPAFAFADRNDRGSRYHGASSGYRYDSHRYDRGYRYSDSGRRSSHNFFDINFGFGSGGYYGGDYSYVGVGYGNGYRPYYRPYRPVYVPAPAIVYPGPVYTPAPTVVYSAPAYSPTYYPGPVYGAPSYYYNNCGPSSYYRVSGGYYYGR